MKKKFITSAAIAALSFIFLSNLAYAQNGCCQYSPGSSGAELRCEPDLTHEDCASYCLTTGGPTPHILGTGCQVFEGKACEEVESCPQYNPQYSAPDPCTGVAVSPLPDIYKLTPPTLEIPIPGQLTNFSAGEILGEPGSRYFYMPWVGEYASAIYMYALSVVGILATVVLIWAGIIWLTAAGNPERIKTAQEYISGAVIGLVLAFGSYLILHTINPDLVNFAALKLKVIERIDFNYVGIDESKVLPGSFEIPAEYSNDLVTVSNAVGVSPCILATHFYLESRFNPTEETSCCYGFGQVNVNNVISEYLACGPKRDELRRLASQPLPPPDADKQTVINWLSTDTRANIALGALHRKKSEGYSNPYNVITATTIYGNGPGTIAAFKKTFDRKQTSLSEEDLKTKLLSGGVNIDQLIKEACVPGVLFPLPGGSSRTFCGNGKGLCCNANPPPPASPITTCDRPTFTPQGRKGVCRNGDDGNACITAGGDAYITAFLKTLKTCYQKYPDL